MASRAKKKAQARKDALVEQMVAALLVFGCSCGGRWGVGVDPEHIGCFRNARREAARGA